MSPNTPFLIQLNTTGAPATANRHALTPDRPTIIGRSSETDLQIQDPSVSRRHASIAYIDANWAIADLGSRHGTVLNGQQLKPNEPIMLEPGDVITIANFQFLFQTVAPEGSSPTMMDPVGSRVVEVNPTTMSGIAQERLNILLGATQALSSAPDRTKVALILRDAARSATGANRVHILRPSGIDEYTVLSEEPSEPPSLSRGLLRAASKGQLVELIGADAPPVGQSIISLGIRSAICAPLMSSGTPDSFLYIDTRTDERTLPEDSAAFCAALANLGSMAIERILAAEMEARRAQIERDIRAARNAQELLMPERAGEFASAKYAYHSSPGRFVAGDFFDIVPISDTEVAFFLGDVSGKGAGAGVVMAAVQGHIRALLLQNIPMEQALAQVNNQICKSTDDGTFVTLLAALWNTKQGTLRIVDAGHGFCTLRVPGQQPEVIEGEGTIPLGITPIDEYQSKSFSPDDGTRIILWSDGAVEQQNSEGVEFGLDAVFEAISPGTCPGTDVELLANAVSEYANAPLADDLTIASIQLLKA